ncbi:YdeI/OmpD-associated family protein [Flavobacterium ginsenosidimutans]|uniref:YdeI/OmpD-associated family protein n=1 Tax=Flavobacterium ginsenosidimutans TaxID=687844 RepID=UPI003D9862EF
MTEYSANSKVDFYFEKVEKWKSELEQMRAIVLDCHLSEELKWGSPCYTFEKTNIVLIHYFKKYCAFLFFKGALMKDPDNILIQQSDNVQAARQIRFTNVEDILAKKEILKKYIFEAAEIEKSGRKVELKKVSDFEIAEELQNKFNSDANFKKAFYALSPGRQRAYLLHFSQPKQSKTREARVEKNISRILAGRGLND